MHADGECLSSYTMTNGQLVDMVSSWCEDSATTFKLFGEMTSWSTNGVTNMSGLFKDTFIDQGKFVWQGDPRMSL